MKHKEVWLAVFLLLLPKIVMAEDVIQIGAFNKDVAILAPNQKAFSKKKISGFRSILSPTPDSAAQPHQRKIRSHPQQRR